MKSKSNLINIVGLPVIMLGDLCEYMGHRFANGAKKEIEPALHNKIIEIEGKVNSKISLVEDKIKSVKHNLQSGGLVDRWLSKKLDNLS